MNDFQRDLEVLINEGVIAANKEKIRFVFKYGNRLKGSIDMLALNDRAYNVLRRNGIHNIESISNKWDEMSRVKNAGVKTIKEIKNKYVAYYYGLLNEEQRKQFWRDTVKATKEM